MLPLSHPWQHHSTISAVARVVADPNSSQRSIVTCRSILDGRHSTRSIASAPDQVFAWLASGELIQHALPHLNTEEREFLISGLTPDAWEALERELEEPTFVNA